MDQQRDDANHRDGAQIAFGSVLHQYSAQSKERAGQGGGDDQRQGIIYNAGYRPTGNVEQKPQRDAKDQGVGKHRLRHGGDQFQPAFAAVAHYLHRGNAQPIAKRRMQRDDGVVSHQILGAIGAFRDGQAQKNGVGKEAAKANRHAVFPIAIKQQPRTDNPQ